MAFGLRYHTSHDRLGRTYAINYVSVIASKQKQTLMKINVVIVAMIIVLDVRLSKGQIPFQILEGV